ncbi:ABC transporter permease [Paenibacillus gansuensis]|uniref:ABC transporter permease n=1 Tax=Paenibacillus gansuensis TaxID=306542 RepID=A0ABW5P7N3_9BACL
MNRWTWTGLVLAGFMIVLAFFGPLLAPYSLEHHVKSGFVTNEQGEQEFVAPPIKPNSEYLFGTDVFGYDILTHMMYGAKYTILPALAVAVLRVMIGGVLGLWRGYVRPGGGRNSSGNLLSGLPMFVIVYFFMGGISINSQLTPMYLTCVLCGLLVILGLPSIISSTANKTRHIKEQQYILSCVALGAGPVRTIRYHIYPQMKESFLILFMNELILTLTIFGQLGIFNIFVGGTLMTIDPVLLQSITHEWAGMAGAAKGAIGAWDWIFMYPMLGYVLLIAGFFCLSKGLEQYFRSKYHKYSQI